MLIQTIDKGGRGPLELPKDRLCAVCAGCCFWAACEFFEMRAKIQNVAFVQFGQDFAK